MTHRSSLCLMAQMVRDRRVSPVELVDSHLARIRSVNPKINAFTIVLEAEARAAAKRAEAAVMRGEALGLLHGVPVTVKDSFDLEGYPTLCGSRFREGHKAVTDSTAVKRFRAAGAIILGKTNAPEFLNNYETDNHVTGRTNNPWNLARTPGGSSGGESAAIAAFCSPGGIGSDGGGSIRIPAHFTGIAGLKPTPGRVSAAGHYPKITHPGGLLGVAGPMARNATDVRLLFSVLAGHDIEDPFSAPVPLRVPDATGLRVGVWRNISGGPVEAETLAVVENAARTLRQIGVPAEDFEPAGMQNAADLWFFFFGKLPAPLTRELIKGREDDAHWTGTELTYRALKEPPPTTQDLLFSLAARDQMRTHLFRQMEKCRVLLTPVCATHAFPHRQRPFDLLAMMKPVTIFNLLGMPAMVIPFGMSSDGLPIGIQLVGRAYDEELLLELATRLEAARGVLPGPPL